MIPRAYLYEWQAYAPWQSNSQVEQDLIIARALVELFSDDLILNSLAFRGGTALHKLFLLPQARYSEDIDLVQISPVPFGPVIDRIREKLSFLGKPARDQKERNNTLIFKADSEIPPVTKLKIKVETNCREHFSVFGYKQVPFEVKSSWFTGSCTITTYQLEELVGTKLRALYQRSKGRDLYDLYKTLTMVPQLNLGAVIQCYNQYMQFVVNQPPDRKTFLENLEEKMQDEYFLGDIKGLIKKSEIYNAQEAYELVKKELIEKI
jgi:predicted nucleotidyltransferase component of viral defense system